MSPSCPPLDFTERGSLGERFAALVTTGAGSTAVFLIALSTILIWLASGYFFHYSDTWQLVMNTATSVITFLMVFLIQRSQNREITAIKVQLSELISAVQDANNSLINLDGLSERQLHVLHQHYQQLSRMAAEGTPLAPPATSEAEAKTQESP